MVEDSSPDGTYEVALELQKLFGEDRLKILKRPGKMGLGECVIPFLRGSGRVAASYGLTPPSSSPPSAAPLPTPFRHRLH